MPRSIPQAAFRFLASNGLATILILLLFLLTLLGTIEQNDKGIYEVQKEYFESFFLFYPVTYHLADRLLIPLPGAYLVLILLTASLICGAIAGVRWRLKKLGILVAHAGIVLLFTSGFLTYISAERATLTLKEGQESRECTSEQEWEISIFTREDRTSEYTEYLIPEEDFEDLDEGEWRTFFREGLPADLELSGFRMRPDGTGASLTARIRGKASDVLHEKTLVAGTPVTMDLGGSQWTFWLRRKRLDLPFTIRLDDFSAEFYPRSRTPRGFRSEVTLLDEEGTELGEASIYMNHPLRRGGYTVYQHRYGRNESTFQVVRNPADQFPLYSTIILSLGLMIHFIRKLVVYLRIEARRRLS